MNRYFFIIKAFAILFAFTSLHAQELREVGNCNIPGRATGVGAADNFAYVAAWGSGLRVIDATDPENPEEIGACDTPGNSYRAALEGDICGIADSESGLRIIDVSDPENPEEVGAYDSPGLTIHVTLINGIAYLADGGGGFRIVDISDPNDPEEIGALDTDGSVEAVFIVDDVAYLSDDGAGVKIVDISDPENPEQIGAFGVPNRARCAYVSGDYCYVADLRSGLIVVDISDPRNPEQVAALDIEGSAYELVGTENYLFVASGGIHVIDISDPENPEEIASRQAGSSFGISVSGNYAYLADADLLRIYDVSEYVHQFGVLEGFVLDAANDEPLADVTLITSDGFSARTDEEGFWRIEEAWAGDFDITASRLGYNDSTMTELHLDEEDTLEVIFQLLHPELTLSVDELSAELEVGESTELQFSVRNDGNGPMEWWVERHLIGEAGANPWELRRSYQAEQEVEDNRLQGVVFVEDRFFVTGGGNDPNMVYILDREGNRIGEFEQFGESRYGMRDLAWDGELIWGAQDRMIYGFTPEGELTTSFEGPYASNTSIAWDPDRELLWIGSTTNNIVGRDREGNQDEQISRQGLRIYGLAYWSDDSDGCPLYVFNSPGQNRQIIHKFNPDTGDTLFVCELEPEEGGRPRGAFVTDQYDAYGSWVFLNIADSPDGDRIDIWQVEPNIDWMVVEPNGGNLDPDDAQELLLTLNAVELEPIVYEGEMVFDHIVAEEDISLPVTLTVHGDGGPRELTVSFTEGWNMISINVSPPEEFYSEGEDRGPDVELMLEQLVTDEYPWHHVHLFKDDIGRFFNPYFGFCNIPYWNLTEGYMAKVDEDVEAVWAGEMIAADTDIPLEEGWNFIAYFPIYELDASAPEFYVLSPIIDNVLIAKDIDGRFMLPEFNYSGMVPWRETQGYQVKVNADVVLNYPPEQEELAYVSLPPAPRGGIKGGAKNTHWQTPFPTGQNMSLLVTLSSILPFPRGDKGGIKAGDQVAAFDAENRLVGVGSVDEDGRCGLAVWGDDPTTEEVDGLQNGEAFKLKLWNADSKTEAVLSVESVHLGQGLVYSTDEFVVLDVSVEISIPNKFYLSNIYPNPFNSMTRITYGLPHASHVSLKLFDLSGRKVRMLFEDNKQAGVHTSTLSAADLPSGLYFVRLEAMGQIATRKVMLIR